MRNNVKWVIVEWSKHKIFVVLLLFLTLLSAAVTVAFPLIIKTLLDAIQDMSIRFSEYEQVKPELMRIIMLFLIIGIVRLIASTYPGFRALMNATFENSIRNRYFNYIVEKGYNFFNKFRTGDLVTRLTSDISDWPKISWFMCSGLFRAIEAFAKISFCITAMLFLNWKLSLLTLAPLPIMMLVFYLVSNKLHHSSKENQEAISEINNQLEMSFSGIKIIKAFVCEDKYKKFFSKALTHRFNTEMSLVTINTKVRLIYEYIDFFGQIAVILFGGILVVRNEITVGTFFAFYTYLAMIIYPILDLPQLFVSGKQAFVNIDRLEEIREFPLIDEEQENPILIDKIEEIDFNEVSFSYSESSDNKSVISIDEDDNSPQTVGLLPLSLLKIRKKESSHSPKLSQTKNGSKELTQLNKINFTVSKGERVIIIGPVGSGKSTILGLLTGLLKAQSGSININGIPIAKINLNDLREKIAFVPQEPILFSGTIRENIVFGTKGVTEALYQRVLSIVQMKEEVERFIKKDETMIGQRGVTLSGGQKQRLAIARALIREPELLIFDDITASLDADNEERLWKDISQYLGGITCFIVSHRLSTLRYVDNVIFLDDGELIAKGKHEEILESNSLYRSFIREHYVER